MALTREAAAARVITVRHACVSGPVSRYPWPAVRVLFKRLAALGLTPLTAPATSVGARVGEFISVLADAWAYFTASEIYASLSSTTARRVYLLLATAAVSAAAVWWSYQVLKALHVETQPESLLNRLRIPGPAPERHATIEAQKARKMQEAKTYATCTLGRIVLVFVLGVGVPLTAVMLITLHGSWLFPNGAVLVDAAHRAPIDEPTMAQLATFAVDLFLKGGLNDVIEVYELEFGSVRHASDNILYAGYVLSFRVIADLFVLSLLFYAGRTVLNWRAASRQVMAEAKTRLLPHPTAAMAGDAA